MDMNTIMQKYENALGLTAYVVWMYALALNALKTAHTKPQLAKLSRLRYDLEQLLHGKSSWLLNDNFEYGDVKADVAELLKECQKLYATLTAKS